MPHPVASYPWDEIGVDLCVFEKENYLIICDYYSNFPEVCQLQSTSSDSVIKAMKYVFSNLGICKECFSDNGLQFNSKAFREFLNEYQFKHTTSSPKYLPSNGLIESSVKIVKNILKQSKSDGSDFYLNLWVYRSSPFENEKSPAALLYGRKIRSNLLVVEQFLTQNEAKEVF